MRLCQVSMRKLIVNGRLRITLTPLLKESPIVGTMQARSFCVAHVPPLDSTPRHALAKG